jgi:hypothetical protein
MSSWMRTVLDRGTLLRKKREVDDALVRNAGRIAREPDTTDYKNRSGHLTLWAVMTGVWAVATVLRNQRVGQLLLGWRGELDDSGIWMSLILPPTMFAVVLLAIHFVGKTFSK